jgi:hypothetical protein
MYTLRLYVTGLFLTLPRRDGVLALAPETAVTTKLVSALFPSPGLQMLIASGP